MTLAVCPQLDAVRSTPDMCVAYRVPEEGPEEAVALMTHCMHADPDMRPTAKEVINRLQRMLRVSDASYGPE